MFFRKFYHHFSERKSTDFTVIRKEVDSIYITLMPSKRLHAFAVSKVPKLRTCVTRSTNEGTFVVAQTNTHNIALVSNETCSLLA